MGQLCSLFFLVLGVSERRGNIALIATLPVLDCLNSVQHLQPSCLEDRFLPQQNKEKPASLKQGCISPRFPTLAAHKEGSDDLHSHRRTTKKLTRLKFVHLLAPSFLPSFLPFFLSSFFLLLSPRIVPQNHDFRRKKKAMFLGERQKRKKKRKNMKNIGKMKKMKKMKNEKMKKMKKWKKMKK